MKSYPNNSKQSFLAFTFIFLRTEHIDNQIIYFIFAFMPAKIDVALLCGKYLTKSDNASWLPDVLSYSWQYFCTELFVRWMNGFMWLFFVEYGCEENLKYPSSKKKTYRLWLSRAHTLISNFLFSISIGCSMYFWIMKLMHLGRETLLCWLWVLKLLWIGSDAVKFIYFFEGGFCTYDFFFSYSLFSIFVSVSSFFWFSLSSSTFFSYTSSFFYPSPSIIDSVSIFYGIWYFYP